MISVIAAEIDISEEVRDVQLWEKPYKASPYIVKDVKGLKFVTLTD
jgi:hypothetical protein